MLSVPFIFIVEVHAVVFRWSSSVGVVALSIMTVSGVDDGAITFWVVFVITFGVALGRAVPPGGLPCVVREVDVTGALSGTGSLRFKGPYPHILRPVLLAQSFCFVFSRQLNFERSLGSSLSQGIDGNIP